MKDIKTKEVTTKPKVKNPASRIPKELMRTAILESKEKSQTIANARDNDMGEQSPSEYASGKVTSAEEWAARKTGRTVTRAGKIAAQASYEKIKTRVGSKKETGKEAARETEGTQGTDTASREAPKQKSWEQAASHVKVKERENQEVQIQKAQRQKAISDAVKTKEQKIRAARETPRIQNGQEIPETKQFSIREQSRKKAAADTARQNAICQKQPEIIWIREKPRMQLEPKIMRNRTIKTAPQSAKISVQPEHKLRAASSNALTVRIQKQMERRAAKQAAKKAALQTSDGVRRIQKTARAGENTFKVAKAAVEAAAKTVQSMMAALGAAGAVIVLLLVIIVGIIGGAAFSGSSESSEALSQEVLSYTSTIQKYANQYGIPEYVSVIQAIMMQESGGRGTDPMQSSECPYNTRYSNSPNAIPDADYSIQVGIQYYADCLKEAGCTSPQDMDKLKLSLQGYNYGNGYITWAIQKYGGYSAENALQFSNEQAASHGWSAYGDPEYVPHVLRYYSSGGLFAGLFGGNGQIVSVALTQLGNQGGQKFWSWYGFDSHVAWCACFASWCGNQAGLIESGKMPKFSLCDDGIAWFQSKGKWKSRGYSPAPGTLIFFDWNGDGTSDHVGIVEKTEGSTVYTVEGNSSDAVSQRSYNINSGTIMGYGII
ncbi:MAG TPA: lysozyme family protein [Lachnoclostridium phocaeense]|uniref:Lysozyme family protein n=1 Tax=Lachnoclostridium phocaeense TaxID=1871021 RepID=A0A921I3V5_9FIRM|nr:lysozyme family protein [Lachnoclostridium phocaeense]